MMSRIFPAILLALTPAVVLAESVMPSIGYTGAPADHKGQNCSVCHSSFGAANSDTRGSVTVSITDYNPGVQQMIHVTVSHPTATRWGFQMTIREVSDETTEAGTFSTSVGVPFTVVCDDGSHFGSAPPCNANNGRQFAEHDNAPRTAQGAGYEWVVPWTPPETEVGRLHIYVAAVAADGDGTAQGDRVYTFEGTLPVVGACSLSVAPNLRTVMNGASFQPPFSSNAMITVFGTNFQASGLQRTVGLGRLSPEDAMAYGATGPVLRGSGVAYDLRKAHPYSSYDHFDFDVPIGRTGDAYDRYLVRMQEMRESLKIITQAFENLPDGPVNTTDRRVALPPRNELNTSMESLIHHFKLVTEGMRVPAGQVYEAIESPRGELGFYLVSDGTNRPYRCKVRAPSFSNLSALPHMVRGELIADVVAVIGSIDIVLGDVDR